MIFLKSVFICSGKLILELERRNLTIDLNGRLLLLIFEQLLNRD